MYLRDNIKFGSISQLLRGANTDVDYSYGVIISAVLDSGEGILNLKGHNGQQATVRIRMKRKNLEELVDKICHSEKVLGKTLNELSDMKITDL